MPSMDKGSIPAAETRSYVIEGKSDLEAGRIAFGIANMAGNKAYRYATERAGGDADGAILRRFQGRFRWYRESWRGLPAQAVAEKRWGQKFEALGYPPLCVDVESAAVCDLACPFCFRQWIATPDKIIDFELFRRIVDQCATLGVPSMKLNWRGEPLLHPQLPEMIDLAKRAGILEVIINTNATTLDEEKSRALIDAGLDMIIYSFDGGSKETYERMRPGRFKPNSFDAVYDNIRRFADIRSQMGAVFPRTRIQMVLTEDTFPERDAFFHLFEDCVDDASVKAYTERGGKISELDAETRERLSDEIARLKLPDDTPVWRDLSGTLHVSTGRLPCEQPFQRLLVTYDGRVSMCCYDWGSQYPVGYVDTQAIETGEREYEEIFEKVAAGAKGFELMTGAVMPEKMNEPEPVVRTLQEIWHGADITHVRRKHVCGEGETVSACRRCTFRETYAWQAIGDGTS